MVPLLSQASSKERDPQPHDHWSSDFQAMLPPSCHFWSISPLHVSKNGLSCPGLDARHFPDTLKRKRNINLHEWHDLIKKSIYCLRQHLCLIEPLSPQSQAWFPPSPWHRTLVRIQIKHWLFDLSSTSFTGLDPLAASRQLSSLMIW